MVHLAGLHSQGYIRRGKSRLFWKTVKHLRTNFEKEEKCTQRDITSSDSVSE